MARAHAWEYWWVEVRGYRGKHIAYVKKNGRSLRVAVPSLNIDCFGMSRIKKFIERIELSKDKK